MLRCLQAVQAAEPIQLITSDMRTRPRCMLWALSTFSAHVAPLDVRSAGCAGQQKNYSTLPVSRTQRERLVRGVARPCPFACPQKAAADQSCLSRSGSVVIVSTAVHKPASNSDRQYVKQGTCVLAGRRQKSTGRQGQTRSQQASQKQRSCDL